jgi:starvation-inducible DNA-binding protein
MAILGDKLKRVLADTFSMYLKAHNYHWNIEGPDFFEYHSFFGEIYEQLHDAVDPIAEHIRAIGEYAPGALSRYKELTTIEDELAVVPALVSVQRLLVDNQKVIDSLTIAYREANAAEEIGLANFLQDRVDAHKTLGWKLRASIAGKQ